MYVATAQGLDEEMRERTPDIGRNAEGIGRPSREPLDLAARIPELARRYPVVLVDCLTLWVSNLLHADVGGAEERIAALAAALQGRRRLRLLLPPGPRGFNRAAHPRLE